MLGTNMKALVTLNNDGHFGVVLIENSDKELIILRELMKQVISDRYSFTEEEKAEAYHLSNSGTIDEIKEWMDDTYLRMGRSGGARIDIIEIQNMPPENLVSSLN